MQIGFYIKARLPCRANPQAEMRLPPPTHLPVLLALSLTLLVDASDGPPDSLLTHLRPLITPAPSSPSRPPSPSPPSAQNPLPKQDQVVQFTKKLYRDLGHNLANATTLADKYQGEFDLLDKHTGGRLGETLATLFEIRMLDLQASIRHARKMRRIIDEFTGKLIIPSSI